MGLADLNPAKPFPRTKLLHVTTRRCLITAGDPCSVIIAVMNAKQMIGALTSSSCRSHLAVERLLGNDGPQTADEAGSSTDRRRLNFPPWHGLEPIEQRPGGGSHVITTTYFRFQEQRLVSMPMGWDGDGMLYSTLRVVRDYY